MGDLLDDYGGATSWDEMLDRAGQPRTSYRALCDALGTLSAEDFAARCLSRDRSLRDQGITFSFSGEERPFPLDLVPRILSATEWATIEAGVAQRVRALEAFLQDVYGEGSIFRKRLVPRTIVTTSAHFHRPAAGIDPPTAFESTSPGSTWPVTARAASA